MRCKASKPSQQTSTKALIARLALILYLAAVCYICFGRFDKLPSVSMTFLGIPMDKLVHFCMFFPFPIIAFFSKDKVNSNPLQSLGSFLTLCSIGCILAGLTEIVQGALPYRGEDIHDYAADCLAIILSSILVLIFDLRSHKVRKNI